MANELLQFVHPFISVSLGGRGGGGGGGGRRRRRRRRRRKYGMNLGTLN